MKKKKEKYIPTRIMQACFLLWALYDYSISRIRRLLVTKSLILFLPSFLDNNQLNSLNEGVFDSNSQLFWL